MRYRSLRVSSLGRWSPQLHAGCLVSGATQVPLTWSHASSYRAFTVCGAAFQAASDSVVAQAGGRQPTPSGLATPRRQRLPAWHRRGLGLPRFARRYYGDAFCSSGYVRCFSSPGALRQDDGNHAKWLGCPIRRSRDRGPLAAPPRLSQLCHVLHRHAAPRHPPYAHCVFPAGTHVVMLSTSE